MKFVNAIHSRLARLIACSLPALPALSCGSADGGDGTPDVQPTAALSTLGLASGALTVVPAGVYTAETAFYRSLGIDVGTELSLLESHRPPPASAANPDLSMNPLSTYETILPHTTQPPIDPFEKGLLTAYLNDPDDATLARFLAVHQLASALVNGRIHGARGEQLRRTILALYFLHRAQDLGVKAPWLGPVLASTQAALDAALAKGAPITLDEEHPADKFFRTTFHLNQEQKRYEALGALLDDFAAEPRNVYTSFALGAINLWIGGEADYADPTILYNFAVGAYVSIHTIELAHELENAYDRDSTQPRFRLAAILGGFSLLQRRWLATVHRDRQAITLIDEEHRLWDQIQPAFHAFTYGLPFFDGTQHFAQGLAAYEAGVPFCQEVPVRTCSDLPRFPFNLLGFTLGYADFLLKAGDLTDAESFLSYRLQPSEQETYTEWTIGQSALRHRLDNLDAIYALYNDGDPSNDPVNFEMTHRKWGSNTTTCQECHQTQAKPQTEADIEAPQELPPPQIASVVNWPAITTAWYGATLP